MEIFYIMGGARTGKDTFKDVFAKHYKVKQISVVDKVKEIAKEYFDWDGNKDEKGRQLLSDLKDAWDRYNDGTIKNVQRWINQIEKENVDFAFIQVREYHSIVKMQRLFGGKTIMVTRGEQTSQVELNKLNDYPDDWEPDFKFENNGTLDEYIKMVEDFALSYKNKNNYKQDIELFNNEGKMKRFLPHMNTSLEYQIRTQNDLFPDFFRYRFVNSPFKIYLSGAVKEVEYRKICKEYEFKNNKIEFVDPLDYDYSKVERYKDIIDKDLKLIGECQAMVCFLRDYTAGTLMEFMFARMHHKPIFSVIINEDMLKDVWIIGNSSKVFTDLESLLQFLDYNYGTHVDE